MTEPTEPLTDEQAAALLACVRQAWANLRAACAPFIAAFEMSLPDPAPIEVHETRARRDKLAAEPSDGPASPPGSTPPAQQDNTAATHTDTAKPPTATTEVACTCGPDGCYGGYSCEPV